MKVTNEIRCYEVNGQKEDGAGTEQLIVKSHWLYNDRVIFEFRDNEVTVLVKEVEKAVRNASNHH